MWQYLSAVLTATSASTPGSSKGNKQATVNCTVSNELDLGNPAQQQLVKSSTCVACNTRSSFSCVAYSTHQSDLDHRVVQNKVNVQSQLVLEDNNRSMAKHAMCLHADSKHWNSMPLDPHLLLAPAAVPAQILIPSPIAAAANNSRRSLSHGRDVCCTMAPSNDTNISYRTCTTTTTLASEPATTCSPADLTCLLSSTHSIDTSSLHPATNLTHTAGDALLLQGSGADCSKWPPLSNHDHSNLAQNTKQTFARNTHPTLKPLLASSSFTAATDAGYVTRANGVERDKLQRVSLFDDAHIIEHVLPAMQASTRALNGHTAMNGTREALHNSVSLHTELKRGHQDTITCSGQDELSQAQQAIHHVSFAGQPYGSSRSASVSSENLRDVRHHQQLVLPPCTHQGTMTGSVHSMHERMGVTQVHQHSLPTTGQRDDPGRFHHLMQNPATASVHAGSARLHTQHIGISCATSNLLDVSVGKSAITSGSVLSMMVGGSLDGPSLAAYSGAEQDQVAMVWLREHLQALGQGVGDKHVFVPFRHLPLPAVGLLSTFLSYVPRIRAITLVHAGIDDAGALELAIGLKQSYGELWLLDLRRNRIGNKGALALAECLPACPALQELMLSHNSIGDEGVAGFTEVLRNSNSAPQRVRLGDNPVSQEALKSLAAAYKGCRIRWSKRESQTLPTSHATPHTSYPWPAPTGNRQSLQDILPESNSPVQGIFDNVLLYEEEDRMESFRQQEDVKHRCMQPMQADVELCGSLPRGRMIALHASSSLTQFQDKKESLSTTTKRLGPTMDMNTVAALVKVLSAPCLLEEHQTAHDVGVAVLSLTTSQACQQRSPASSLSVLSTLSHTNSAEGHLFATVQQLLYDEGDSCKSRALANSSPLPCSLSSFRNAHTPTSPIDLDMLAAALIVKGHDAVVTTTGGSGEVTACLQNLRHQYITVITPHPLQLALQNTSLDGMSPMWSQHDSSSIHRHSEVAVAVGFSLDGPIDCQPHGEISMHQPLPSRGASRRGTCTANNSIDVCSSVTMLPYIGSPIRKDLTTTQHTLPLLKNGIQHHMAVQTSLEPANQSLHRSASKGKLLQRPSSSVQPQQVSISAQSAHGAAQHPCVPVETPHHVGDLSRGSVCLSRASVASFQVGSPRTAPSSNLMRVVVDPTFKEQFQIGNNTTERYQTILASLPDIYVGHEDRLPVLVEILCEEMSLAFKERGLSLPPWRKASSLMTRWKQKTSSSGSVHACSPSHIQTGL